MRILMVCKSLPHHFQGGIQTHVWKLSGWMKDMGHQVSILTAGKYRNNVQQYNFEGRDVIEIPYFPGRHLPALPLLTEELSFNLQVRKWLQTNELEYDIIHLQGRSGYMFPGRQKSVPVVTTLHGLIQIENKHAILPKDKTYGIRLHELAAAHYEKNSLIYSDALIAVSDEMRNEINQIAPSALQKMTKIYNGIDPLELNPAIETDPKMLLFVGRLSKLKGIYPLLEAMKQVKKDIRLVMVGDGPEKKEFRRQMEEAGLGDRIHLTGGLPSREVYEWIQKSHALILPSFHETQGIVLMEANICGKPVLASRAGGIGEVVKDGFNGLLFEPGNVDEIAQSIHDIFENPEMAREMGSRGKEYVMDTFSWEKIADSTLRLYEKVIQQKINAACQTPKTERVKPYFPAVPLP